VIIPAYNRAALIGETLASIEAQTWHQLEIVVVDDGSTDDTVERLRLRPPQREGRTLRVITQVNAGVSAARNTGTRAATGEFILYMDSDDLLLPEAVTRYVEAMREHGAGYCFAPIDSVDESGRYANEHELRRYHPKVNAANFLFDCQWLVHGCCCRREAVNAVGPWSTGLIRVEDAEWFWRLKTVAGRGYYLNLMQGYYRHHSRGQLHVQADYGSLHESRVAAVEVFAAWLRRTGRLDREMRLRVARQCRFLATRLAVEGRREASRRAFRMVASMCEGLWHPLRLSPLLGRIGSPVVLEKISQLRYRWWRWRHPQQRKKGPPGRLRELLFLSPLFPNAEGAGPARRAAMTIKALSKEYRVTLLVVHTSLHSKGGGVAANYLGGRWDQIGFSPGGFFSLRQRLARRFPGVYARWRGWPSDWEHLSAGSFKQVRQIHGARAFDVVHAFRLATAPHALDLVRNAPGEPRLQLDLDDVESVTHGRIAELMIRSEAGGDGARRFQLKAAAYARAESRLLPGFGRIFVCSEKDRERLASQYAEVRVLPNGVEIPDPVPSPQGEAGGFRFLFVGSFGYYPNRDAVEWFCGEMLPGLKAVRACSFAVGGRAMPAEFLRLIEATAGARAFGEFATVADGFAQGDALVVPLRAGGGTRIKILEAFAHGRPVVSTTIGIEGIEAVPERDYLLADTPEEFVRQCLRLIDEPALRAALAGNARRLAEARYSPGVIERVLAPDGAGGHSGG